MTIHPQARPSATEAGALSPKTTANRLHLNRLTAVLSRVVLPCPRKPRVLGLDGCPLPLGWTLGLCWGAV